MKFPNDLSSDFQTALRLIDRAIPETDEQFEVFIAGVDAGKIPIPATPERLSPSAIVKALLREELGISPMPEDGKIHPFHIITPNTGLSRLRMAARNGDGALSEETLRRMEDAQDD